VWFEYAFKIPAGFPLKNIQFNRKQAASLGKILAIRVRRLILRLRRSRPLAVRNR